MERSLFARRDIYVWAAILAVAVLPGAILKAESAAASSVFIQHNLVSDVPGLADFTDPHLGDLWGISENPSGPFWVSNHSKGTSTLYNGSGQILSLVVTVPGGKGGLPPSKPTGQVFNNTTGFVLANGKPASFIFATEDGTISAWNGGATATLMVDDSGQAAVYKGLAIGSNASGPLLYAPNFRSGSIDVFDGKFNPTSVSGGFVDANLPAGYAPFNIWNLGGKLYVAYAKQNDTKNFDVPGAGNGYVNVFDTDGKLLKRVASAGPLNSPWGLAIAPAVWPTFGGALLVGNFGDGTINAFDLNTGATLGTLQDSTGKPIAIPGLWALLFGNGKNGGDKNILYFGAGLFPGTTRSLLGSIAPPAAVLGVMNGASLTTGPLAPGEIVVLDGLVIGPSPLASAKIPEDGPVDSSPTSTTVTFNNTPAPVLYASASQTSVQVPYELAGASTANVVVKYRDQTTSAFQAQIASAAPGLFTMDFSGSGAAVVLNQDGSINSATNPAAAGSVVALYATGEGVTNPPSQDGVANDTILRVPTQKVSLTIGGQTATVLYAGSSPDMVSGLMEVEAIIPDGAGSGPAPVVLTVGAAKSQANVTIYVK